MRGLGPSIDLGSLFSELMDVMENNSLSCSTASHSREEGEEGSAWPRGSI